jgi:hypothetical protein
MGIGPLDGQRSVRFSLGARYSSTLVRDSIVTPFEVRPNIAPTLGCTLVWPLQTGWSAQVGIDAASSELMRHDTNGSTTALGRVTTIDLSAGVRHQLSRGFTASGAVGALKYFPGEEAGIFREGSGPIAWLVAMTLEHPLSFGATKPYAVEARYDLHSFTTPALRDEGFDSSRLVHRVSLSLRYRLGR